ncbi:MAG: hypothetical protein ACO1O6_11970 [Bacteroidota bacterium]
MKPILLIIWLGISSQLLALDAQGIVRKMNEKYASCKSYSLETQYELFKGAASDVVEEFYTGLLYKSEKGFYQQIQNTQLIYSPDFFLKINSDEKSMLLEEHQDFGFSPIDFNLAVKECGEIEVKEKEGMYIILMYFKNNSAIPLSLLELHIHKKTFLLSRMDLFYSVSEDFSKTRETQELDQPHLRISFSNFDAKPKDKVEYFKLDAYLQKQDKKYIPAGIYKNYTITDNRKK